MTTTPSIIAIDGPSASGKGTIARKLAAHFGFAHLDTGLLYRAVGMAVVRAGGDPSDAARAEQAAHDLAKNIFRKSETIPPPSRGRLGGGAINNPDGGNIGSPPPLAPPSRGGEQDYAPHTDCSQNPLDDVELRGDVASVAASKVAAIPAVRAALLQLQKDFAANPPNGTKGAVLDGRDIGTVIAPYAPVKLYITASTEARADRRFKELQSRGDTTTYAAVLQDMIDRDARDTNRAVAPAKPADDAVIIDTTAMTAAEAFAKALAIAQNTIDKRK